MAYDDDDEDTAQDVEVAQSEEQPDASYDVAADDTQVAARAPRQDFAPAGPKGKITWESSPEDSAGPKGNIKWEDYTGPESVLSTIARELKHEAPPAVAATIGGAAAGGALGAAIPLPGTTFLGAVAGGAGAAYGASKATEAGLDYFGLGEDADQREANRQANPWSYYGAHLLSNLFGFNPAAKVGRALAERGTSAAISGGFSAGAQKAQGQDVDWREVAAQSAAGAIAPRMWEYGQKAQQLGERIGAGGARPARPDVSGSPSTAAPAPPGAAPADPINPDQPHGTPGAQAAAGTAEMQNPPAGGGPQDRRGPENWGKQQAPAPPGGGVNIGGIDPTVAAAVQAAQTPRPITSSEAPSAPSAPFDPAKPGDLARYIGEVEARIPRTSTEAPAAPTAPTAPTAPSAGPEAATSRQPGYRTAAAERALTQDERDILVGPEPNQRAPSATASLQRHPDDFMRLDADIPAAAYAQRLRDLQASKPPPVDPQGTPAQLAAQQAANRVWNAENLRVSRMARLAARRDALAQGAGTPGAPAPVAPGETPGVRPAAAGAAPSGQSHPAVPGARARPGGPAGAPPGTSAAVPGGPPGAGGRVPPGGPPRPPGGAGGPPPAGGAGGPPPRQPVPPPQVSRAGPRDAQRGPFAYIGRLFHAREGSGVEGNLIYRKARGEWQRLKDQAFARLESPGFNQIMHRAANTMDMNGFREFMKAVEGVGGRTVAQIADPVRRQLATALKQGLDDVKAKIASLPRFAQMQFVQDYFPHMFENNQQLDTFFRNLSGAGHGSFNARTHLSYEDAFNHGLTPISSNPIEMFTRYIDGIGAAVQQAQIMHELEPWIQWRQVKQIGASGSPTPLIKAPPFLDYEPLKMPWAQRQRGPIVETAWVPRDMAWMLNQAYEGGFRGTTLGPAIDAAQKMKNVHTALELGGPMYHFNTVTTEAIGSGFSRALRELATARPDRAAREFALALPRAVMDWAKPNSYGTHLLEVWKGNRPGTPAEARIMDALAKANIHPVGLLHTGEFEMTHLNDLWTSYWRGDFPRELRATIDKIKGGGWEGSKEALAFIPSHVARAMQTIGKPLFQYIIPRLKLTAMVRDMEQYLFHNPNATDADLQRVAYKTTNSIDNRFGEAVRDNLGMNKYITDVGYTGLRSFAWTVLGPFREIAGGYASLGKGLAQGEWRVSPKSHHYDPRIAYALAFPITIGFIGGLVNYLRTGQWPQDWRDLYFPRTGGAVRSGGGNVPERMRIPGYHKDFFGYAHMTPEGIAPGAELRAKIAGIWQAMIEQATNRDWRDYPIAPPNATLGEQVGYRGEHLLGKFKPIGLQQITQEQKIGSKLTLPERIIGFAPAGVRYQNPQGNESFLGKQAEDLWKRKERADNADRRSRGLPPLPPRQMPRQPAFRQP